MTNNQIAYMNALETQRANLAKEGLGSATLEETKRSNISNESIKGGTLGESIRHNMTTESVAVGQLGVSQRMADETARSNKAKEYETSRSNIAKEQENVRSNTAREQETTRSNLASEFLISTRDRNSYEVNRAQVDENIQHNRATEITNAVGLGTDLAGDIIKTIRPW